MSPAEVFAILVLLLVVGLIIWKTAAESEARKNYIPPAANEKIVLPEMKDEPLPARSGKNLRFCPSCGAPNSDQSAVCTECGSRLYRRFCR